MLITVVILGIYFLIKEKDKILNFLVLIFIVESLFVLIGSSHEQVGGRYAVVPGILLLFIMYRLFQNNTNFLKFFFMIIVINSLVIGAYEFRIKARNLNYLDCINCPIWVDEVKKMEN